MPIMTLWEAKEECRRRVVQEYEVLEANVDRKYLTCRDYLDCINDVMAAMVREGLITEDQVADVKNQRFS
jgi:hypothetical protein